MNILSILRIRAGLLTTATLLHLLLNNKVASSLTQRTAFNKVVPVFVSSLLGQLLLGSTPLQLFVVRFLMLYYELPQPSVSSQALYVLLLVLNLLATIWRGVLHTPLLSQVHFGLYNLNFEFVLSQGVNHLLDFNVLLGEGIVIISQVLSLDIRDAVLT